jgi:hypothetical protein
LPPRLSKNSTPPPAGQRGCALALALGSVACTSAHAPIDLTVQRDKLRVEITELAIPTEVPDRRRLQVALRIAETAPNTKLLRAVLGPHADGYCFQGVNADRIGRSGPTDAGTALTPGERVVLEFRFDAVAIAAEPSAHLNLLLETPNGARRCVTLPLGDGQSAPEWEYDQRFSVGIDLGLEGFTAGLGSVRQIVAMPLSLGVWFDAYHLELSGGLLGAGCPDDRCKVPEDTEARIDYSTSWLFAAGLERPLWEHAEWSFGFGVRYRALHLVADTFEGRESFWAHGPVLTPRFGAGMDLDEHTGLGGSRSGFAGIEVPVGYLFAENGDRSLSVGVTLRFFFTVF